MVTPYGNPVASLAEYELRHLAAHLEAAERDEDLHCLLALETGDGHNAWYEARESVGGGQGYLADMTLAWRLAEANRDIPRQIQYLLCRSSLASISADYPPELLSLAVRYQHMTVFQALSVVRQMPNAWSLVQSLEELLPYLQDGELLGEALAIARSIIRDGPRAKALTELAPHLPVALQAEVLQDALAAARSTEDGWPRVEALAAVARYLPEALQAEVLRDALAVARSTWWGDEYVVKALAELALHLPESLGVEALRDAWKATRKLPNDHHLAKALAELAPLLPEVLQAEALHDALAAARSTKYGKWRVKALVELTPHLPQALQAEALQGALAAAGSMKDAGRRFEALTELAPHLPVDLRSEALHDALKAARSIRSGGRRVEALTELAQLSPEDLRAEALHDALAVARSTKYGRSRVKALTKLAPYLPEDLRAEALHDALEAARSIKHSGRRVEALTELASCLPEAVRAEAPQDALAAARFIKNGERRVKALVRLVPHLPEALQAEALQDAFRAVTSIQRYHRSRLEALGTLVNQVQYLSEARSMQVLRDFLDVVQSLPDVLDQTELLVKLVPCLPEAWLKETLTKALKNVRQARKPDPDTREWSRPAKALSSLVPHLPETLLSETLTAVRSIRDRKMQGQILVDLLMHLPEDKRRETLPQALSVMQTIGVSESRARVLTGLLTRLPLEWRQEIARDNLTAERSIEDDSSSTAASAELAQLPPEYSHEEALETARLVEDDRSRASELIKLIPRLSAALRTEAVCEALEAAWSIEDESSLVDALIELVPYLPVASQRKALQEVLRIARAAASATKGKVGKNSPSNRWEGLEWQLVRLAPAICQEALRDVLEAACSIEDEKHRATALIGLAPHLPIALQGEALTVARAIRQEGERARALTWLARHLPADLQRTALQDALAAVRASESALADSTKARHWSKRLVCARISRAGGFPETTRADHVMSIQGEDQLSGTGEVLDVLAAHLHESVLHDALEAAWSIRDQANRAEALLGLAPRLPETLRQEALQAALTATKSAEDDDARECLLCLLAPHLPKALQREALEAAQSIKSEWRRVSALRGLTPYLSEALLEDLLVVARSVNDEWQRFCALRDIAPRLPEPLLSEAVDALLSADVMFHYRDGEEITHTLALLGPHMSETLLRKALAVVRSHPWFPNRTHALVALAEFLPEALPDAIRERLPDALQQTTVLEMTKRDPWDYDRDPADERLASPGIAHLGSYLAIWARSQPDDAYVEWKATLHRLETWPRSHLLGKLGELMPFALAFAGNEQEAARDIVSVIQAVTRWWP